MSSPSLHLENEVLEKFAQVSRHKVMSSQSDLDPKDRAMPDMLAWCRQHETIVVLNNGMILTSNPTSRTVQNCKVVMLQKGMQPRRIVFKIGIVYQTPVEQVERVPGMIKDILKEQGVRIERVHFSSLGDSSLLYEIAYHVLSSDYNVYMDKQQAINLNIMRRFEKEGIQFAYPTQTLYVNKT